MPSDAKQPCRRHLHAAVQRHPRTGVSERVSVSWGDLLPHDRLVRQRVQNLGPGTVAIDAHGGSLYQQQAHKARARQGVRP